MALLILVRVEYGLIRQPGERRAKHFIRLEATVGHDVERRRGIQSVRISKRQFGNC
jgi:hypothetical protein